MFIIFIHTTPVLGGWMIPFLKCIPISVTEGLKDF